MLSRIFWRALANFFLNKITHQKPLSRKKTFSSCEECPAVANHIVLGEPFVYQSIPGNNPTV